MSLQHELRNTRMRIPELDTTVLGSTEHPIAVRSKSDTENKVLFGGVSDYLSHSVKQSYLVSFEGAHALASWLSGHEARAVGVQLPHLDRLVKTTTDQAVTRGSKSYTIDTVLVALLALETHNESPASNIPYADALV